VVLALATGGYPAWIRRLPFLITPYHVFPTQTSGDKRFFFAILP
jgi:hypothetical protein